MAIQYIADATNASLSGTSPAPAVPTGTQDGDLMIAFISTSANDDVMATPASGWTLFLTNATSGGQGTLKTYVRIATASEPASYTWAWTTGASIVRGTIVTYRGVDRIWASMDATISVDGSVTAHSIPTMDSFMAGGVIVDYVVRANSNTSTGTWTAGTMPSGVTANLRGNGTGGGGGSVNGYALQDGRWESTFGSAGATTINSGNAFVSLTAGFILLPEGSNGPQMVSSGIAAGSTQSITANLPGTFQNDDLLIMHYFENSTSGGITGANIPSGWTKITEDYNNSTYDAIFYKYAAGDSPTLAVNNDTSTGQAKRIEIVAIRNAARQAPLVSVQTNASSTDVTTPGVTTIGDMRLWLVFATCGGNKTWTPSNGFSRVSSVNTIRSVMLFKLVPVAGAYSAVIAATINTAAGTKAFSIPVAPSKGFMMTRNQPHRGAQTRVAVR